MAGECEKQEATILGLERKLGRQLSDLQARLDTRFNRTEPDGGYGERLVPTNVLDEIISDLEDHSESLAISISFISNEVLPKISE